MLACRADSTLLRDLLGGAESWCDWGGVFSPLVEHQGTQLPTHLETAPEGSDLRRCPGASLLPSVAASTA